MKKYIFIKSIKRITSVGEVEEIQFEAGVNIIKGEKNAGKSTWLKQIDYLLGKNAPITEVFTDTELSDKYVELSGIFIISGKEIQIKRLLKEPGLTTKIFMNEIPISVTDFSVELLKVIGIPDGIKFPKGNPYNSNWVELGFRSLFRHLYRRETLWGDFADKQPPNEQFAAQFHLLGIATQIFSKEFNSNINDQKRLAVMQEQRDQYTWILNRIMKEMSPREEEIYENTSETEIQEKITILETEINNLEIERNSVVEKHLSESKNKKDAIVIKENEIITNKMEAIRDIEINAEKTTKVTKKINQYRDLASTITEELGKLKRTKKSGLIADLKITHCPACDQEILKKKKGIADDKCFLCTQPLNEESRKPTTNRLEFEMAQLESEQKELDELIAMTEKDLHECINTDKFLREKLYYIELDLAPLKKELFALSYQDLSEIDFARGKLQEQLQNYKRLLGNVKDKISLAEEINALSFKIDRENEEQEKRAAFINFERIAYDLETGMQYYVNYVKQHNAKRNLWVADGKISVGINDSRLSFYVNNKPWTALGAQDQELFLLAYHFGLLTLTGRNGYNVPGLIIIDLPPEIGLVQEASYNYVVAPFIKYCTVFKARKSLQVIITGSSFDSVKDSKVIDLNTNWK